MKTIEQASLENSKLHYTMAFSEELHKDADIDFRNGVEFAQRWIPVDEELPEIGLDVILLSKKWITKHNKKGIRIGFIDSIGIWTSASFVVKNYITLTSGNDYHSFKDTKKEDQKPTHWRPIQLK